MAELSMVPLAGSGRTGRPGATLIGPVPGDEWIEFAAVLRSSLIASLPFNSNLRY